eukprot:CCRYP_016100-RA/>CCRYP_016100-RA protein AED:0.31 eAED:0.31 QI:141/1/1/1/1/1/2/149/244
MSSSVGELSRLDWGADNSGRGHRRGEGSIGSTGVSIDTNNGAVETTVGGSNVAAPSSRYDPKAMSRIVDITDLVDDASESSDDEDIIGHSSEGGAFTVLTKNGSQSNLTNPKKVYGPGGAGCSLVTQQFLILFALLSVIIGACVAIGYAVIDAKGMFPNPSIESDGNQQQHLLKTAERIVTACSEGRLNEDMSDCQKLCHSSMCCFDSGEYNCKEDESKACAVFAGCEALIDGAMLYEDELGEE